MAPLLLPNALLKVYEGVVVGQAYVRKCMSNPQQVQMSKDEMKLHHHSPLLTNFRGLQMLLVSRWSHASACGHPAMQLVVK